MEPLKLIRLIFKTIRPSGDENAASISYVWIRSRDFQQRITLVESGHQIRITSLRGDVANPPQQSAKNTRVFVGDANEAGVSAQNLLAGVRQGGASRQPRGEVVSRSRPPQPPGVAARNRLFVTRLIPQTDDAGERSVSPRHEEIFRSETERRLAAKIILAVSRIKLSGLPAPPQKIDYARQIIAACPLDLALR